MSENSNSELDSLKAKADKMGIKYPSNVTANTLRRKINNLLDGKEEDDDSEETNTVTASVNNEEAEANKRRQQWKEAMKLVRVIVTPMSRLKSDMPGDIFTVSNRVVGTVSKYVPFGNDAGYHIPFIIYQTLKDKRALVLVEKTNKMGIKYKEKRLIPAYNIQVLEPLSEQEIEKLAKSQSARQSIED